MRLNRWRVRIVVADRPDAWQQAISVPVPVVNLALDGRFFHQVVGQNHDDAICWHKHEFQSLSRDSIGSDKRIEAERGS